MEAPGCLRHPTSTCNAVVNKKSACIQTWDERILLWLLISSDNIIGTKYCDCYLENSESTGFQFMNAKTFRYVRSMMGHVGLHVFVPTQM